MIINLAGKWKLRGEFLDMTAERYAEVMARKDGEFKLYKDDKKTWFPSREGFMTAEVPCDVIQPLVKYGLLDEPLLKTNAENCMWVGDLSWWFTREFDVTEEFIENDEIRLKIEVLDYNADIIINGIPVGKHKNAFRPFYEDVKKYIRSGTNHIIIRLTTGYEERYPLDYIGFYCNSKYGQRLYLRKPQFTHGWDWCKPIPTCGMGGDIYLEAVSGAKIAFCRFDTLKLFDNSANVGLHFEFENFSMVTADDATLAYELLFDGKVIYSAEKEIYAAGGINYFDDTFTVNSPALWYPNGYGEQPLYTVTARVICRGVTSEMRAMKVGIRTVKLSQDKLPDGTRRFDFVVNGIKVFCKGGNWVPADSVYLRIPESTYETLVNEACECNFTMLRIWGGGLYEPDRFYELCSEHGLLVMQDFMYACALYPDYLPSFMHEAALEADYQTRRLASYACLAVWTGNNEVHESYTDWFKDHFTPDRYFGTKIFNYLLPDMVRKNSPLVHYMPSSPFYGNKANDLLSGDSHIWSWMRQPHDTAYRTIYELEAFDRVAAKVRFSSEYGFYGTPNMSTVARYHDGEQVKYGSEIWNYHGDHESKHKLISDSIDMHLTEIGDVGAEEYILYGGIMQGCLYGNLATSLRFFSHCSGDLIWMYNDCWPETGWTVIDYYLTRKISFYFLKRAFATKAFVMRIFNGTVDIVALNETNTSQKVLLEYGYMTFDGVKSDARKTEFNVGPHSRAALEPLAVAHDLTKGFYYAIADGFETALSIRGNFKTAVLPKATVEVEKRRDGDNLILTLRTDKFAPVVCINCADDRLKLSDNYFALLPGEIKTVTVYDAGDTAFDAYSVKFGK